MPCATSAASKSSMLPRACPDSARAIISSALKVRISPSDSSIVRSSARAVVGLAAGLRQRLLGAVAQARQRRLQIMGDVVGDLLQPAHQRLDALQHGVEVLREPVELVAAAADRQPPGEIAGHDALRGPGHGVDALQHAARDEDAAAEPEHDHEQRPTTRRRWRRCRTCAPRSSRSRPTAGGSRRSVRVTRTSARCSAVVLLVEPAVGGLRPAGRVDHAGRERADIAGERLPGRRRSRDRDWRPAAARGSRSIKIKPAQAARS